MFLWFTNEHLLLNSLPYSSMQFLIRNFLKSQFLFCLALKFFKFIVEYSFLLFIIGCNFKETFLPRAKKSLSLITFQLRNRFSISLWGCCLFACNPNVYVIQIWTILVFCVISPLGVNLYLLTLARIVTFWYINEKHIPFCGSNIYSLIIIFYKGEKSSEAKILSWKSIISYWPP